MDEIWLEGLPGGYPKGGVARGGISHERASSWKLLMGWNCVRKPGGSQGKCVMAGNSHNHTIWWQGTRRVHPDRPLEQFLSGFPQVPPQARYIRTKYKSRWVGMGLGDIQNPGVVAQKSQQSIPICYTKWVSTVGSGLSPSKSKSIPNPLRSNAWLYCE